MRTLSVVIPVKDDAVALERCLRLLGRQSLPPTEVVVVDNASTDTSAQVARTHGARVVHEPRPGIPAAASAGYDAATGDLIVRCDADTAPPRDWLERVARRMDAEPGLEAVTGSGRFYDLPWWLAPVAAGVYLGAFYVLMYAALARPPLWGSNMAVRRETWQRVSRRVHREDPELHDDVDLAFALGPHCRTRYAADLRVGVSARSLRGW
ncbi:glycosyltransferase family 2 protein, partial [Georgenia sp. 10Sc9-8]|nr:glycosyltransferase family 2 protein [Georgenia halotolerans]